MRNVRKRYWYFVLLILPAFLGNSNVRAGGDYLPGAIAGLLIALFLVAFIELAMFLFRVIQREK
jgi:hypothetical protein